MAGRQLSGAVEEACSFFDFHTNKKNMTCPFQSRPFIYSNKDLMKMDTSNSEFKAAVSGQQVPEGKYAWVVNPLIPAAWSEVTWSERGSTFKDVELTQHTNEHAGDYKEKISNVFPSVQAPHVTPFNGMTDILLRSKQITIVGVVIIIIIIIELYSTAKRSEHVDLMVEDDVV